MIDWSQLCASQVSSLKEPLSHTKPPCLLAKPALHFIAQRPSSFIMFVLFSAEQLMPPVEPAMSRFAKFATPEVTGGDAHGASMHSGNGV